MLYEVHSIFYTIQGEGPFIGHPAYFIRLAGCNLQCPGCDTDYTSTRRLMTRIDILVELAKVERDCRLVVLTGGEPFRQNIGDLLQALLAAGYRVQIETNGVIKPDPNTMHFLQTRGGTRLFVVCSPKTPNISNDLLPHVDAFKYVITAGEVRPDDGLPHAALRLENNKHVFRKPVEHKADIYVTPFDPGDASPPVAGDHYREAANSALKFGYHLNCQMHKVFGLA